jgi:hypothetical protein
MVRWTDEDDAVIGGDLTAALAYVTPAGGAVATPVAPLGLRDRTAGTVSFTTSLGFGRKLERLRRDAHVALAYHARAHGFATGTRYVLVQGAARFDDRPDPAALREVVRPAADAFMGPMPRGRFWAFWLREYLAQRVLVTVAVERVVSWPDLACAGTPRVAGAMWPGAPPPPPPQAPPHKGTAPRIDVARMARRLARLPQRLLAYRGADGLPVVVPVRVGAPEPGGVRLGAAPRLLPRGGRRAGLLAHAYRPRLVGMESRVYTGWLQDGLYAPHTETRFLAPPNKTAMLLANGGLAKWGVLRARRAAAAA